MRSLTDLLATLLCLGGLAFAATTPTDGTPRFAGLTPGTLREITIPTVDISGQTQRHVIIAQGTTNVYQGHCDTVLMADGKTMFAAWCINHAGHLGPLARSDDAGRTWTAPLPVPANWTNVTHTTPTVHRLTDPRGVERLFVFGGCDFPGNLHQSVSEDGGKTWSPMASVGLVAECAPKSILAFDGGRKLMMWCDRRDPANPKDPAPVVWQSTSRDGGLTWEKEQVVLVVPGQWAQPAVIRSPDRKQFLMLMRENTRQYHSLFSVSNDDARTWSAPRELPAALMGDRPAIKAGPDGRLVVAFRDVAKTSPTYGHYVAWVGRYDDIVNRREGQYRIKLLHNAARRAEDKPGAGNADCGYSDLELLPDGTFMATTYIKYRPGPEKNSVVSTRFKLSETDVLLAQHTAAPGPTRANVAYGSHPHQLLDVHTRKSPSPVSSLAVCDRVRFFPARSNEAAMVGGRFEGSNVSCREEFELLDEIKGAPPAEQWSELKFDNTKVYRWLRYVGPRGSHAKVAELEFYAGQHKMSGPGVAFSGATDTGGQRRFAFDGDTKTTFESREADDAYIGVDLRELATARWPQFVPAPTVSPALLVYSNAFDVTIKCPTPGAVIRYTLDGSWSSETNGKIYTAPLHLEQTTTIQAVAFLAGRAPTPPISATYLVKGSTKPGQNTFHWGNSLTQTTALLPSFIRTAGYAHRSAIFARPGAWTKENWEIGLVKEKDRAMGLWNSFDHLDHVTVQPRDFNIEEEAGYDIKFFNMAREKSPDVQPWLYCEWTELNRQRPTDKGTVPSSQMKTTFPALTWEESMGAMLLYMEELQRKVCETYKTGKRPRVLPTALAMGWIRNMFDRGRIPGIKPGSFYPLLFNDQVHPSVNSLNGEHGNGGYLVDLTWFAAFYGESPEGKILPIGTTFTREQNAIIQRLAWDVIRNYPDCGLYEEGTTPCGKPEFVSDRKTITLKSATPGAWFRYTLDGTTPTRTRGYVYCGVISVQTGIHVKAIAYKSGMADSEVGEMADRQSAGAATSGRAARRPNILFFHADQHNARVMGCAGHPDVKTPTLDRLAATGVLFQRAYTQAGICTPSRTSLMTGLYPRTTGVLWNSNQDDGQVHAGVRIEPMVAWFKSHGYRTAAFGRRHLADAADIGWTRTGTTYDRVSDESYQDWLRETGNYDAFKNDSEVKSMELCGHVTKLPAEATEEAWMARKTIEFTRQAAKDGQPLFCWVPFLHPHHTYTPLAKFHNLYDPAKLTLPAHIHEPEANLPPLLRRWRANENNPWCLGRAAKDDNIFRRFLALYYGCVTQVDDAIGQILRALEASGQLDNTIVIYTADHGDFAAHHGLVEKYPWAHNVYEEILRVPFIVSWPAKLRKGNVRSDLVEETDIYPTLLELTGVERPKDYAMVGRSLVPTLTRGQPLARRYAFSETSMMATVIGERYKLGVFLVEQQDNYPDMLFDRIADPLEVRNLCDKPEVDAVEKELRAALAVWMARTPAVDVKTLPKMPNNKPAVRKQL